MRTRVLLCWAVIPGCVMFLECTTADLQAQKGLWRPETAKQFSARCQKNPTVQDFPNGIEKPNEILLLNGWNFALSLVFVVRRNFGFSMRFLQLVSEMMWFLTKNAHHFIGSFGAPAGRKNAGNNIWKNGTFLLKKSAIFNHWGPSGSESPVFFDFGWFCQGNHIVLGANSWKTDNCYWLETPKHGILGWFDNNFISGDGKEHFSMVGRRLLKLWVLVVPSADVGGCFIHASDNKHGESWWILKPKSQQPSLENCWS